MIFVCLGNPGRKYRNTKHNVGKMFGEYLVRELRVTSYELKKKNIGKILELENGWQVVFLDCLMNNSGQCLRNLFGFTNHKSQITNHLFVVHDDLDILFGQFKIQKKRGSAGHRGVESIINALGTKDFGRIRIGIGRPPENISPEKYVLMHFTQEELSKLEKIFEAIIDSLAGKDPDIYF
jgi:PTH1 family peptidyl-tRNA hydrolase